MDPTKQFHPLTKFGNAFLNRFQCSNTNSDVLKSISILDTPGILSGEKQRLDRGYDFVEILRWFAERVDRILLLFDAHKLDISDEFKKVLDAMKQYEEKVMTISFIEKSCSHSYIFIEESDQESTKAFFYCRLE